MIHRELVQPLPDDLDLLRTAGRRVELSADQTDDISVLLFDASDALKYSAAPTQIRTAYSFLVSEPISFFTPVSRNEQSRGIGFDAGPLELIHTVRRNDETMSLVVPGSGFEITTDSTGLWVAHNKDSDKEPITLSNHEMLHLVERIASQSTPIATGIDAWRDKEYPGDDVHKTLVALAGMASIGATEKQEQRVYADFRSSQVSIPEPSTNTLQNHYTHRLLTITESSDKTSVSYMSMEPLMHIGEGEYVKRQVLATSTLRALSEAPRVTSAAVTLNGTVARPVLDYYVTNEDDGMLFDGVQRGIGLVVDHLTDKRAA